LIWYLARPYESQMSDWGIWYESKIQKEINKCAKGIEGEQLFVFGDGTYGLQSGVMGAYRPLHNSSLTTEQKIFNQNMSQSQIATEWAFGKVIRLWGFMGHKMGHQIGLSPVGIYFPTCVLLTNCHTCYYSS
ncbi:hypothetical protein L873DRAFT_1694682, partial [Choiromyces venosus 120613-1]